MPILVFLQSALKCGKRQISYIFDMHTKLGHISNVTKKDKANFRKYRISQQIPPDM